MKQLKTIEELEKELKVLFAKYYQTIERLKKSKEDLLNLLSDLSAKTDELLTREDLIKIIKTNTAYMNLLSLSRSYLGNIQSLKYYLQALRNTKGE